MIRDARQEYFLYDIHEGGIRMNAPTVHIAAAAGQVAETVLLPGDPLRAQFIAQQFLTDAECYSKVRGMLGFTGWYKGKRISVQGTGMGGPSMGIYAHELIHAYGARRLIRIGSAGALQDHLKLGDLVGVTAASYDTDYHRQLAIPGTLAPAGSFDLLMKARLQAEKTQLTLHAGPVLSSDLFYHPDGTESLRAWQRLGLLAVEMEAASLYVQAQCANIEALCLLTISDLPFGEGEMSSGERERSLTAMIGLALEVASG